jgi:hypothetical protein
LAPAPLAPPGTPAGVKPTKQFIITGRARTGNRAADFEISLRASVTIFELAGAPKLVRPARHTVLC